ncbi:hypothetical protein EGR_10135 [Echinococcus granulosus]|uniref:Uncharacterized protein n=1 Tax=Echinococcus granulosus TaxID=6210 RepID=W6U958_ECHGR|nr:hypothetical protein EGR_10135 [Echinococcus granulosus]EUB55017.1 hypothetical protein EGR_10135 [Echinococcus granulosus]
MAHSAIRRFRLLRPTPIFQLFTLTHFNTTTRRILIDATPPVGHRCRPPSKTRKYLQQQLIRSEMGLAIVEVELKAFLRVDNFVRLQEGFCVPVFQLDWVLTPAKDGMHSICSCVSQGHQDVTITAPHLLTIQGLRDVGRKNLNSRSLLSRVHLCTTDDWICDVFQMAEQACIPVMGRSLCCACHCTASV